MATHQFTSYPQPPTLADADLTCRTVSEGAQRVRVVLAGEIDLSNSNSVVTKVTEALQAHGSSHVHVDLAEVRFLDSTGVNALMRCRARAEQSGCQLVVTNPQPIVYQVLEITGVLVALAVARPAEG